MITTLMIGAVFWVKATFVDVCNILFITSMRDKFKNKKSIKWEST